MWAWPGLGTIECVWWMGGVSRLGVWTWEIVRFKEQIHTPHTTTHTPHAPVRWMVGGAGRGIVGSREITYVIQEKIARLRI